MHILRWVHRPSRIFWISFLFAAFMLLGHGTLWNLWNLHQEHDRLVVGIQDQKKLLARLEKDLQKAQDPAYIELQARDRLDMIAEDELVFVFPAGQ